MIFQVFEYPALPNEMTPLGCFEESADGFERGLIEGEGVFVFNRVGFVKGHERKTSGCCIDLGVSSFFLVVVCFSCVV